MSSPRLNDSTTTQLELRFFGSTFTILQDPNSHDHGLCLWDAAECFLRYLEFNPRAAARFRGRAVLELGAGTGLLGIVLAHCLQCRVVLTDLPGVCPNLAANINANPLPCGGGGTAAVLPCAWSGVADAAVLAAAPAGGFDFIVGTDVAYSEALNDVLLRSAAAFARASARRCVVFFCNEVRCAVAQGVFDASAPPLFRVKRIQTKRLHPAWRAHNQLLLELSLKGGGGGSREEAGKGEGEEEEEEEEGAGGEQ
jgi:predicted nicotinamide N-methyase